MSFELSSSDPVPRYYELTGSKCKPQLDRGDKRSRISIQMSSDPTPQQTKASGRPPKFDSSQVVSAAMELFWRHGYDATSLSDLETELSVNRSTMYASFDGKAGLYRSAVGAYIAAMEELLIRPLIEGEDGIADLVGFVERLRGLLMDSTKPDGCLIVNAMGTGQPPECTDRYLAELRTGFDSALERATRLGEIAPGGCEEKASAVLSAAIGLNVVAKAGSSSNELERLCDGVRSMMEGWRLPTAV